MHHCCKLLLYQSVRMCFASHPRNSDLYCARLSYIDAAVNWCSSCVASTSSQLHLPGLHHPTHMFAISQLHSARIDVACTLLCAIQGKADATWVFMGWEGVDAKRRGVGLNAFSLEDSNIPYGYSPVLVAATETLQ